MKKLKKRLMIFASGLLLLLTGCTHDGLDGKHPITGSNDMMTFTFRVDGMITNSATRAAIAPTEDETSVQSLHLLFFNASGDQSGSLAGTVALPGGTGEAGKLTMETRYLLPGDAADISPAGAYNIIAIGNLNDYVDDSEQWLEQWEGQTEAYFRDHATVETVGTEDDADYVSHRPIKANALLMNGYVNKQAGVKDIQMVLTRNVARFDVQNNVESHTLKTVSVWNAFKSTSITGDVTFNYTQSTMHSKRYYGIECDNDVEGGIYAFENYSESPTINDKTSTCLIVGLEAEGQTRYYRVNINSMGAVQRLKRDYAYNITILSVTGNGYASENEAWEGTTNQLTYLVNNWDYDNNGLIVSDEYSILAVPVKTVKIGSAGGDFSYSITTFSTLENPEPLRIKSQLYEPADGNITARISNGNLVIEALPMNTGEEKRSGIITISFAGLETMVNVMQTAAGDVYLEVTLDDGWREALPPTANAMSEYIYVNASGPWTAQLHGSANFAFQNSLGEYVTKISSADFTNNKFHVYTSASNESKTDTEKAFVLVSLDSDPTNYIAVVTVYQASRGGIDTYPINLDAIRFFGSGRLQNMTGNLEENSDTRFKFQVSSSGSITANNIRLTGADYEKFDFIYDPVDKYITVWAKDVNATLEPYTAVISIADNRNGNLMINLVQGTLDLTLDAPERRVPVTGGTSDEIVVSIEDPNAEWTATLTLEGSVSKELIGHGVKLLKSNGSDLATDEYTNQNLKVKFDKVYYPNRDVDIKAVITVTTRSGLTKTCEVYQNKLVAKGVSIWNTGSGYGMLGNLFFAGYTDAIKALGFSYSDTYSSTNTTYTHFGNGGVSNSNYNWATIESFRKDKDGVLVMVCDHNGIDRLAALNSSTSPLHKCGYTVDTRGSVVSVPLTKGVTNTRIGQLLTTQGVSPISNPTSSITSFYRDGTSTELTSIPSTAISILSFSEGRHFLTIDPVNKIVFLGDGQAFDNHLTGNRKEFMNNLICYVINAAKYGSHFTEMFIDNSSVPAPWDTHWGNNAWPH